MQKLSWMLGLVLAAGCRDITEDDVPLLGPMSPPAAGASLDASVSGSLDAAAQPNAPYDAGVACETIPVCSEGKPGVLYNVCLGGSASGAASGVLGCLVDPNGSLYLVSLASGQTVLNRGWKQSAGAAASTLSADDAARCAQARADLAASDASTPPCASF